MLGGHKRVQLGGATNKVHITKSEQTGVRVVHGCIFAGSQKEEETEKQHVGDGVGLGSVGHAA